MKVYIAGPMSAALHDYKERFNAAADQLREAGHVVMNPAILPLGFEHHEYLRICRVMIEVCEAVYFLPGWEDSPGSQLEYQHAEYHAKVIRFWRPE